MHRKIVWFCRINLFYIFLMNLIDVCPAPVVGAQDLSRVDSW